MVFQGFELFPHLNVMANLQLGQMRVMRRSRNEAAERALHYLERGAGAHRHKHPGQLSGEQQQRRAIARALCMDPIAMLSDEPIGSRPEMVAEVLDVMVTLAQEGMTMMCVPHEMGSARKVSDQVLFMDYGCIVEDWATRAFFTEHEQR